MRSLAAATISGDRTMIVGDSTLLNVNITGDLPADFTLSDGRSFVLSKNPFILEVRPTKSTTYFLKEVKNSCGLGNVSGSAKVTILDPLAGEESLENTIKVFPNPASQQLFVEFLSVKGSNTSISLSDLTGKILQQKNIETVGKHQDRFDIKHYPTGSYFLKFNIDKQVFVKKIIINSE